MPALLSRSIAIACCLLTSLIAARAEDNGSITYEGKDGPGKGKHIVLLAGDEEYRSEEAMPMLAKILSQRHGFKCTVLFSVDSDGTINPNKSDSISNPAALDTADAIIMSLRFRKYPEEAAKHFADAIERGVPVIGLRTSTHAFSGVQGKYKDLNKFGKKVLGEDWVSHWGGHKREATRGVIEAGAKDDPLLKGVTDVFGTSDVYEAYPPEDAKILLRGQVLKGMTPSDEPASYDKKRSTDKETQKVNDPMMAIAWSRSVPNAAGKTNRILCTTMGAATDLTSEGLRRLVVNGIYWGLDLPVPDKADVTYVDDYQPLMYGFNGYRAGLKPSDHALGKVLPEGTKPKPVPKQ
jgi:type 1 glutamine amidotransferase